MYMPVHPARMNTISASEARAALPEILDRVLAGEEVTITRHGQAVAVVVRPDALSARRADAQPAQDIRGGAGAEVEDVDSQLHRIPPPPATNTAKGSSAPGVGTCSMRSDPVRRHTACISVTTAGKGMPRSGTSSFGAA